MNKWLPIGLFTACFLAIVSATLYYGPSWGLMDDFQFLNLVRKLQTSPDRLAIYLESCLGGGMVRPVLFTWAAIFYAAFNHWPTGFYIFNAVGNMAALIFWGMVFYRLFSVDRKDFFWTVFFFPLTFFIFTAFWNIFNYISLQEKFIVFLAPLAILCFERTYRDFQRKDLAWLCVVIVLGLCSKATFLFIPLIFLAYAVLDLVVFHYRSKLSWLYVALNGIIFVSYAMFTFMFQLRGSYVARYKTNLSAGVFLERIFTLPLVMKSMLLIGLFGLIGVAVYCLRKKRPESSLGVLIYLGLIAYVFLLSPWGSQSYLLSAAGPLVMGGLFPLYYWVSRRGGIAKTFLNGTLTVILFLIFIGDIAPNISRMGDIGRGVAFLTQYQKATAGEDIYFMPPPYSESASATAGFTGKNVIFCTDGKIASDLLSREGHNYVIFNDLFPSIHLTGVELGEEIFSNRVWKVFRLLPAPGHEEEFTMDFPKNAVQQLKIKIRNLQ